MTLMIIHIFTSLLGSYTLSFVAATIWHLPFILNQLAFGIYFFCIYLCSFIIKYLCVCAASNLQENTI